jgi:hypothetical protein
MQCVSVQRDYQSLFHQFWPLYLQRPIKDNRWGCQLPPLFALWVFLRETRPTHVIESGVWKGQTTWLITTTLPEAQVLSLDPFPDRREWSSPNVRYSTHDFAYQDLRDFPPETTLAFFDDHVHAFLRLMLCRAWGIRHIVFDDNYPAGLGDPSINQALTGSPAGQAKSLKDRVRAYLKRKLAPGEMMLASSYSPLALAGILRDMAGEHEVFPPLYCPETTRWGTKWTDTYGDVRACLDLDRLSDAQRAEVERTAAAYTCMGRVTLPGARASEDRVPVDHGGRASV